MRSADPTRPATAQARLTEIKAEWQATTQSVQSRATSPDLQMISARPGSLKHQRAVSAQARNRLKALERDLHMMNAAGPGLTPAQRARRIEMLGPSAGERLLATARSPASIQKEEETSIAKRSNLRKDDLIPMNKDAGPIYPSIGLPSAGQKHDTFRRLPPIHGGSIGGSPSIGGSLRGPPSIEGSVRNVPVNQFSRSIVNFNQSSSKGTSAGGGEMNDLRQTSRESINSRVNSATSRVSDISDEKGGWIAYDDIREIIHQETKKAKQIFNETDQKKAAPSVDHVSMSAGPTVQKNPDKHPSKDGANGLKFVEFNRNLTGEAQSEIPEQYPDGSVNPYFLLKNEMPRTLTVLGAFGFSRRSLLRSKCILIVNDNYWKWTFELFTIANAIFVVSLPSLSPSVLGFLTVSSASANSMQGDMDKVWPDFIFLAVFYVQVFVGCVAWGFTGSERAWFNRDHFHRIDFLVFLASVYEIFATWILTNLQPLKAQPLRLLRIISILIRLRMFESMKQIAITLGKGNFQFFIIFSFFLASLGIFSVFGMAILQGSFRRRCASLPVAIPACSSKDWNRTCSFTASDQRKVKFDMQGELIRAAGYPLFFPCKIIRPDTPGKFDGVYPKLDDGNYHTCQWEDFKTGLPVTQMCLSGSNPKAGWQHFDNIGGSVMAILQIAMQDGGFDILTIGQQSEPESKEVVLIFVLATSLMLTFLIPGLFVAVVTGTFHRVRTQESSKAAMLLKMQQDADEVRQAKLRQEGEELKQIGKKGKQWRSRTSSKKIAPAEDPGMAELSKYDPNRKQNDISEEEDEEDSGENVRMHKKAAVFLKVKRFHQVLYANVVLHTVVIVCAIHGVASDSLYYADFLCNVVWIIELAVRYVALQGLVGVIRDPTARTLCIVMCCTLIGWISDSSGQQNQLNALKLIPVLRIYRLMKFVPNLDYLLVSCIGSSYLLANLATFVALLVLVVATAGRYLFDHQMNDLSRSNFGTFLNAMLTTFQMLVGDSYSEVIFASLESKTTAFGKAAAGCFLFAWFVFAQFVVKPLFVAVIIENFQLARALEIAGKPGYFSKMAAVSRKAWNKFQVVGLVQRQSDLLVLDKDGNVWEKEVLEEDTLDKQHGKGEFSTQKINVEAVLAIAKKTKGSQIESAVVEDIIPKTEEHDQKTERSLFLFPYKSPIRQFCIRLSQSTLFDSVILLSISTSIFFLMTSPPTDRIPKGPTDATPEARIIPKDVVDTLEIVFTIIFASEFSTRVIAKGLFWTKDAYLKSGWNIADSVVLFFSILDSTQLLTDGGVAKVMRLTRALRPLRLMKRNVGMKVLFDALLSALYPSAYVALFALWTTFVFAVFGMGLFQELLDQCSAPGAEYPGGKIECSGFHVTNDGFMLPRAWVKPFPNWDTIDTSMLLLFQLSNNRYVVPLQSVMDVTQRNLSPKVDHSAGNSLFIVTYIVISSMFIFSIFIGFIIDGFNVPQGPDPESELNFGRFLRAVKEFAPRVEKYSPPKNKFSVMLRQIVQHKFFSSFTFSTVAVSIIFILLDHDDPSPEFMLVFQNQELVLFWLLVLEIILVVGAYGHAVLNDPWKGLDVLVCIGTAIGIFADRPEISRSARCFRVLRIIRLLKTVKAIRVILDTLISSMPQVANIVALIFLFWSIFAVAFNQLYSNVKYGFRIGPNLNFKTYYDALRTVYQIVTGEPWPILIEDSHVTWPSCTPIFSTKYPEYNYQGPDYEFGDCGDQFSPALFVVCILFCNCIMINLFIGMVLDNFAFFTENADDGNVLLDETGTRVIWTSLVSQVHVISQIYKFFDFSNTGLVPISSLFRMMLESPQPLGFGGKYGPADKAAFKVIRAELNVRCLTKWHLQKNQPWYIKTSDRIFFTLFGGLQRNSSHMRVTFEDYIMTLFYWRKSESVPAMLQQMRVKGLSKILTMSQALIIRDFMWGFGPTINRRSQVLKTIKPRRIFFKWGKGDKWYCRYRTYKLDVVQKAAAKAARNVLFRNILPGYPNCTFLAMFTPLEDPPIGDSRFISVPRAVTDCQTRSSYQASLFAIESFLKMTRGNSHEVKMQHYVVCRFVDDRTVVRKKWGDVVWLADFSTVEWFEWNITQVQEQAYLEPKIMPDRCDEATPKWSEVKMRYNMAKWQRLRDQRKNMTEEAKDLRARAALMGLTSCVDYDEECLVLNVRAQSEFSSLIAIQAYMVANGKNAEPECALRLILGTHSLAPSDVRERQSFELGLQKCRDCVVEVLGYVPKLVAARATDFIIAKDEESEKDGDSESEKQSESAALSEAAIDQEHENADASGEEGNDENSEGEGEYRNNDEGGDEDGEEERGAVKEVPEAHRRDSHRIPF